MDNRIGSACWYKLADSPNMPWKGGTLRAWGTDFDQPNSESHEVALFPVGVVEDDKTGLCHSVYVTRICFAAIPPGGN